MDILQFEKIIKKTALEEGFLVSISEKMNEGCLVCKFFHVKTGEKCCLKLAVDTLSDSFVCHLRYYLTHFKQSLGIYEGAAMTVNVFISQPMSGRHVEEIQEERDRIVTFIKEHYDFRFDGNSRASAMIPKGFDLYKDKHEYSINVVNPIERENAPDNAGRLWYLGQAISDLEKCDLVIFARGWETSKGCCVERDAVRQYGIPYSLFENDILSGVTFVAIK